MFFRPTYIWHPDHEITAVYSLDEVGGENGGGDGVPDKYQKKVTFQVVNGTWEDGTSAARVTYVTLMKAISQ